MKQSNATVSLPGRSLLAKNWETNMKVDDASVVYQGEKNNKIGYVAAGKSDSLQYDEGCRLTKVM